MFYSLSLQNVDIKALNMETSFIFSQFQTFKSFKDILKILNLLFLTQISWVKK